MESTSYGILEEKLKKEILSTSITLYNSILYLKNCKRNFRNDYFSYCCNVISEFFYIPYDTIKRIINSKDITSYEKDLVIKRSLQEGIDFLKTSRSDVCSKDFEIYCETIAGTFDVSYDEIKDAVDDEKYWFI